MPLAIMTLIRSLVSVTIPLGKSQFKQASSHTHTQTHKRFPNCTLTFLIQVEQTGNFISIDLIIKLSMPPTPDAVISTWS